MIADLRDEFAQRSPSASPDEDAAFIQAKLDMIRSDPRLSPAERAAATAELEAKLRGEEEQPPPS